MSVKSHRHEPTVAALLASTSPGCVWHVAPPAGGFRDVAALRRAAEGAGWQWVAVEEGDVMPAGRSVVLAGHGNGRTLAGRVLGMAHLGVRSIVVLASVRHADRPRASLPSMAREACATYGGDVFATRALGDALARWRANDIPGAMKVSRAVPRDALLADGVRAACDLVVLESILARESGALLDAEALSRAAQLAARLASEDECDQRARLALARVLVERGQRAQAVALLDGVHGHDPPVRVIAHAVGTHLAIACGALAWAGWHVGAIEALARRDSWAECHLWDARARLRRAARDWHGVLDACAHGGALANMRGWQRRAARFASYRAEVEMARAGGSPSVQMRRWIVVDDLVAVLETCQEQADEATAIARVGARLVERLGASGVAVIGRVEGPGHILGSYGVPGEIPEWVDDLLAAGVRRRVEGGEPACCAAPIRTAGSVIGALLCRWPPGAVVPAAEADALVETAAAALAPVVGSLTERKRLLDAGRALLGDLVGPSPAMQAVREAVLRAAGSPFPVLVEGESGTGKELVARAVHRLSPRRSRPFVAINCAAVADELVEAELFGHARGAFTGAIGERRGMFEEAAEGTLFLDEVAELSARAQAKLLRALQEGEVRRVGENRARRVDVRVVAASNRSLAAEARAGRFRTDLLYRLDVIRIGVPPLRARLEDLPALAAHLWRDVAARAGCRGVLSTPLLAALAGYDWPGNVRELQNVLATVAVSASRRGVVPAVLLPSHLRLAGSTRSDPLPLERARREFDTRYVAAALARAGGRQAVAARELGLTRQGLAKLMARLRLPGGAASRSAGAS